MCLSFRKVFPHRLSSFRNNTLGQHTYIALIPESLKEEEEDRVQILDYILKNNITQKKTNEKEVQAYRI